MRPIAPRWRSIAAWDMLDAVAAAFTGDETLKGCLFASATASGSLAAEDVQRSVGDIRRDIVDQLAARIARDIRMVRFQRIPMLSRLPE